MLVGLLLVLASLIVVFCLFHNFIMNKLDPFSIIFMSESGVTVNTIWHKAVVESFRFSDPSDGYHLFVLIVVVKRTIFPFLLLVIFMPTISFVSFACRC